MRKNNLIDLLSKIKGNPDILLYNGFVDDFMDFNINEKPYVLVKHSQEFLYKDLYHTFQARNSRQPDETENQILLNQAENRAKKETWEFPNEFVTEEEDAKLWYGNRRKNVFIIEAKRRGKKCYDRAGSLEY